jgi:hypothetical protein
LALTARSEILPSQRLRHVQSRIATANIAAVAGEKDQATEDLKFAEELASDLEASHQLKIIRQMRAQFRLDSVA